MERSIAYSNIVFDAVGLATNLISLSYFLKRRKELGNVFLSYLNIADSMVCLSDMIYNITTLFQLNPGAVDYELRLLEIVIAVQIARCSITLTGIITIYLNVLRTSAIIWPMVRFKKRLLHASLLVLITIFVAVETAVGVLYTHPYLDYHIRIISGFEASPPYGSNHPLHFFVNNEHQILGIPIVIVVMMCCIASITKLIFPDNRLHVTDDRRSRRSRNAAVTVLILSIQYVLLNAGGLVLYTVGSYYQQRKVYDKQLKIADQLLLKFGIMALVLNSALNPVVYFSRVKKLREPLLNTTRRIFRKRRDKNEDRPT
jgi:hypothetical protein